jgi:Amt family ammonium transporter
MVFMDTAATIPTGSMAERLKFSGFVLMGLWVSMFIYPLVGNWVWGGGWLANLGRSLGWGNGAVDFAGSGVVHMIGGAVALAGAIVIGPRIGKFNKDGSANTIPGHSISLGVLGTIILFFGWFGFNPGSSLGFTGGFRNLAILAAVNTLLAGAAGGLSAMFYMWWFSKAKKPDPGMSVNGVLAGLVPSPLPCAFVDIWAAVVIGLIAVCGCGAASVFAGKNENERSRRRRPGSPFQWFLGSSGSWYLRQWKSGYCAGMVFLLRSLDCSNGNGSQLLAQGAERIVLFWWAASLFVFFKVLSALGLLRVSADVELEGLDIPEMGAWDTSQGLVNFSYRIERAAGI